MFRSPLRRVRLGFLAGLLWVSVLPLSAAEGGFTATLSNEQRDAAGLSALADDERAALDQLVAEDLSFARREKLTRFDDLFSARLDEAARKQAGLDRLTAPQLAKLNELVAAAIASRPAPKQRPRLKDDEVLAKRRGEVHGSVTVAYGWGAGGRDFRAGSLWLDYYDPESRVGVGVGITTVSGDGFYGYAPGYYSGRYYPGSFSFADYDFPAGPIYVNGGSRGFGGGGFQGDGSCFRMNGNGGRRR